MIDEKWLEEVLRDGAEAIVKGWDANTSAIELTRLARLGLWAEKHGIKTLKTANSIITEEWPEEHWKHDTCFNALAALKAVGVEI